MDNIVRAWRSSISLATSQEQMEEEVKEEQRRIWEEKNQKGALSQKPIDRTELPRGKSCTQESFLTTLGPRAGTRMRQARSLGCKL